MATNTAFLGMTLPAATDKADIAPINQNFEILDSTLQNAGVGKSKKIAFADLDSARAPGRYHIAENELAAIGGWQDFDWYVHVDAYDEGSDHCVQHLYPVNAYGLHLVRYRYNGAWKEPEWENPPMDMGVEYRTTERHNKLPVYVKLVDCGSLPNASTKNVYLGDNIAGENIVSFNVKLLSGTKSAHMLPWLDTSFAGQARAYISSTGQIQFVTKSDMSAYTATVTVKFTKP